MEDRAEGGVTDKLAVKLADRSARQARRSQGWAGLMGCFLAITTASLTEAEKGGDVAATPNGFFEVFMQPALNKKDGTKKGQKSGRGGNRG
jgi:hypothetical protein